MLKRSPVYKTSLEQGKITEPVKSSPPYQVNVQNELVERFSTLEKQIEGLLTKTDMISAENHRLQNTHEMDELRTFITSSQNINEPDEKFVSFVKSKFQERKFEFRKCYLQLMKEFSGDINQSLPSPTDIHDDFNEQDFLNEVGKMIGAEMTAKLESRFLKEKKKFPKTDMKEFFRFQAKIKDKELQKSYEKMIKRYVYIPPVTQKKDLKPILSQFRNLKGEWINYVYSELVEEAEKNQDYKSSLQSAANRNSIYKHVEKKWDDFHLRFFVITKQNFAIDTKNSENFLNWQAQNIATVQREMNELTVQRNLCQEALIFSKATNDALRLQITDFQNLLKKKEEEIPDSLLKTLNEAVLPEKIERIATESFRTFKEQSISAQARMNQSNPLPPPPPPAIPPLIPMFRPLSKKMNEAPKIVHTPNLENRKKYTSFLDELKTGITLRPTEALIEQHRLQQQQEKEQNSLFGVLSKAFSTRRLFLAEHDDFEEDDQSSLGFLE